MSTEHWTLALIALILALEAARWVYDVRWQRREERELLEQTTLLNDILVTLLLNGEDQHE